MFNFSFKNYDSVLGLDIGFQSLKLTQIRKSRKGVSLVGTVEIPLEEKILDRDKFRNKANTANLIKEAMKKAKPKEITARKIISALPETFVFSKTIKMPRMSAKQYMSAIPNEISSFLPTSVDNFYFDYQILVAHPDQELDDILVVATPKNLVDDYVEMAKLAGLELIALETKPLAVGRAIIDENDKDGCMIIHLGTEYSRIGIWDDGQLKLTTTVSTGQNQLLESLNYVGKIGNRITKLSEENKKDIAIPLNSIIEEAINAIKYHHNRSFKPKPIKKIILCGSGILIEGLDTIIEDEMKIKTEINKIKLSDKAELEPQFVAAYGLALRNESE
jgi:type IV pilus assembly protein PilM